MKHPDRIVKLLIGAALVAIGVWIAMHTYWGETTVPTPMTGEAATNPHYSIEHLATSLGIHTRQITSLKALPTDAVVLINDFDDELVHEKIESVENWVESGGRLVVSANTLWASQPLQNWSGVKPDNKVKSRPPVRAAVRSRATPDPETNCAALVEQVDGSPTGQSLTVCAALLAPLTSRREPAWMLTDVAGLHVLRIAIGDGEFAVLGPFQLLHNRTLLKGDNAEVLIGAAHLQRGDTLLILKPSEGEPLPMLLWRVAAPAILFLGAALLLLIVRYLPRFGPPIPAASPIRRSLAEQIRANARFAWRTGKLGALRGAVRRALDEAAKRQIAGYGSLNVRQQSEVLASTTGIDTAAIGAALTADGSGNMNEHRASLTLLEICRRMLINNPITTRSHER